MGSYEQKQMDAAKLKFNRQYQNENYHSPSVLKSLSGTVSGATGVDKKTVDAVGTVLAPGTAATDYVVSGQAGKDVNVAIGDLNKRPDGVQIQDPSRLTPPTLAPGARPVTMSVPEALRRTAIAPVAGPTAPDFSQSAAATGFQSGLASDLALASRGQGPSLAAEQLKQANAANLAATYSMMASQRGGPTASGARVGMQTAADLNAKSAQDAAMARIKEQTEARAQLGQVTAQMRHGDVAEVGLTTQVALEKYRGDLQLAVEQGKISAGEAHQQYAVAADTAKQNALFESEYNRRVDDYVKMGLDVASAQQRTDVEMQKIRAGIKPPPTLGEQILSGVSQMAGPVATVFGGPAAGVAAGATANALRPVAESYTEADAEPSTGINANRYGDTTSYRQQ